MFESINGGGRNINLSVHMTVFIRPIGYFFGIEKGSAKYGKLKSRLTFARLLFYTKYFDLALT